MATHDKYDNDILKALQKIANSLVNIEKHMTRIQSGSPNALGNPNQMSVEDIKECMKNFDPDSAPNSHVLLMKED